MNTFIKNNNLIVRKPFIFVAASTQEVNSGSGSVCSTNIVSNTIPGSVLKGDLIVSAIFARRSVTNSDGFTLLEKQDNAGTTTGQYSALYTKLAEDNDANRIVSFNFEGTNSVSSMAFLVLRSSTKNYSVDNIGKNGDATNFISLPSINNEKINSICVAMCSTTVVYNTESGCNQYTQNFTVPDGYTQTTISSSSLCVSCSVPRMSFGYKILSSIGPTPANDKFAQPFIDGTTIFGTNNTARCGQIIAIFSAQ